MESRYVEQSDLSQLPRWACAALASRCVRRVLPVIPAAGAPGGEAVERLLDRIDECVATYRELAEGEVMRLIDEVDDLEVALRGQSGPGMQASRRVLAAAKFAAYGIIAGTDGTAQHAYRAYQDAAQAGCFSGDDDPDDAITNSEVVYDALRADFEAIAKAATAAEAADAATGRTLLDAFGPLWPRTTPSWARGQSTWDRKGMVEPPSGAERGALGWLSAGASVVSNVGTHLGRLVGNGPQPSPTVDGHRATGPNDVACEGCGSVFTAPPEQRQRPLGRLCGGCLEKLPRVQPPGHSKPEPGAVTEEQQRRRAEFRPPTAGDPSPLLIEIEQLLIGETGLLCIPRQLGKRYLRVIRREHDHFFQEYLEKHLTVLVQRVEPLTREGSADYHAEFQELCLTLQDAPNLEFIAATLGVEETQEGFDPAVWFQWAAERRDEPATCLYCMGNFLAVPPIAGPLPDGLAATVHEVLNEKLEALRKSTGDA